MFQVVFGEGPKTGANLVDLVDKDLIDKVGFTGSTAVGRHIGEICGRNLQVPCLELGGKNPLIVTPSANLDLAAHGIVWSGFGTGGQRCTSLGNLIVHESVKQSLMEKILAKVKEMRIGDPFDADNTYGPLINARFLAGHLENLDKKVKPHHKLVVESIGLSQGRITSKNKPSWFKGNPEAGYFVFPTILDGVTPNDEVYSEETFGPFFNVLAYKQLSDAMQLANGTGYGLSSAIYTNDPKEAYHFKNEIGAGMSSINNSTTGAEAHLPFGGNGKSGNGSRQSGIWVLDAFTKWQSVNWDLSGKLQLAQMETGYIEPNENPTLSFLGN